MAEDRVEPREWSWRQRMRWTELFRGFWIAFDFNKLILAACGIVVMAFGWWLLAVIFAGGGKPEWGKDEYRIPEGAPETLEARKKEAWRNYKRDWRRWDIRFTAAGPADSDQKLQAGDFADSPREYEFYEKYKTETDPKVIEEAVKGVYPDPAKGEDTTEVIEKRKRLLVNLKIIQAGIPRPSGSLRTWPWQENRGPNPFLMVAGKKDRPWTPGRFWEWVFSDRVPVLLEPLFKLLRPVYYFLQGDIGFVNALYFILTMLWAIITWSIFGGAITRIAAVQIARDEKITLGESVRFVTKRLFSFISAPLFPMVVVAFLLVMLSIFGLIHMIPFLGEIIDGLFWIVIIIFGLAMALGLIGLVGWPLMSASISADGADSWEAVNRSYSYVFQAPWHYLWYTVVALAYGAIIAFFVGFMGSFAVYLGKWGMSQMPFMREDREPAFLFVYTPTSFGWRDLLLSDVQLADGSHVVDQTTGEIIPQNYRKYIGQDSSYKGNDQLTGFNKFGAALVTFWVTFFFLLVLGFSYSYFWSAFTLIYFLLRRKVDEGEMDEIYFEEEDLAGYTGPMAPPGGPATPANEGGARSLTVVEPPMTAAPPPPAAPPPQATPPSEPPPLPPPTEPSSSSSAGEETTDASPPEEKQEEKPSEPESSSENKEEGSDGEEKKES